MQNAVIAVIGAFGLAACAAKPPPPELPPELPYELPPTPNMLDTVKCSEVLPEAGGVANGRCIVSSAKVVDVIRNGGQRFFPVLRFVGTVFSTDDFGTAVLPRKDELFGEIRLKGGPHLKELEDLIGLQIILELSYTIAEKRGKIMSAIITNLCVSAARSPMVCTGNFQSIPIVPMYPMYKRLPTSIITPHYT